MNEQQAQRDNSYSRLPTEEHWGSDIRIESSVGDFTAVKVTPETAKAGSLPVVVVPGWSAGRGTFNGLMQELSAAGRTSWSLDFPRKGGKVEDDPRFPTAELRKAHALISLIESQGLGKVQVIAHSEGAYVAAIAATLRPDLFQDLVLVGPVGLLGKDNLPSLVTRFAQGMVKEQWDARKPGDRLVHTDAEKNPYTTSTPLQVSETLKDGATRINRYFGASPLDAVREGVAISQASILPLLKDFRKKGKRVIVVQHADDKPMPMKRMQKTLSDKWWTLPEGKFIDVVDGVYIMPDGHQGVILQPGALGRAVRYVFDALDKNEHMNNQQSAS